MNSLENLDSKNVYESLGLIYGDGSLKRMVSFSNTYPELVNHILRFFKDLGISKNKIRLHIKVYRLSKELNDKELINFWKSRLDGVEDNNFIRITRKQRTTRNIRKRDEPSRYGLIEVYSYSKIIQKELQSRISEVKDLSKTSQLHFLRGLIAAEGSIKLHNEVLREVRISSTKINEQQFIREILKSVGIKPANAIYKNYIAISGFQNLILINNYQLCSLHPEKRKKFISGYKELENRKCLHRGNNRVLA